MTTPLSKFKSSELSKSGKKENKPVVLAPTFKPKTPNGGSTAIPRKTATTNLTSSSVKTKENQNPISYKPSHLSSHLKGDSITPINNNRHLKSMLDSSNKSVYGSSSVQKSIRFMNGTSTSTVSRNILNSANKSKTTTSTTPYFESRFSVNPVVNGVDYTNIMLRKHELGYIGPGYIVEFNCNPEFLRGIVIDKGLHKVTKIVDPSNGMIPGAQKLFTERIDVEDFTKRINNKTSVTKTPLKSLIPKVDLPTRNFNYQVSSVVDTLPILDDSVTNVDDMDIEEKPTVGKSGHSVRFLLSPNNHDDEDASDISIVNSMKKSFHSSKHRRSASCSDLPKFIISEPGDDDDDENKPDSLLHRSYMNMLRVDPTSKQMNETYDKSLNSSYQPMALNINLNITNDTSGLTLPGLQRPQIISVNTGSSFTNSSFLEGHHQAKINLSHNSSSSSLLSTATTTNPVLLSPLYRQQQDTVEQRVLNLLIDSIKSQSVNASIIRSESEREATLNTILKFEQALANIKQHITNSE